MNKTDDTLYAPKKYRIHIKKILVVVFLDFLELVDAPSSLARHALETW